MPARYASTIQRSRTHRPNPMKNPPANQPEKASPILITDASAAGTVLSLTFNDVVRLERGTVPGITTDVAGAIPISAAATGPNAVAITFDNDVSAATSLNIPNRDPAIRNASGGYVTSNTFPIAA